MAGYIVTVWQLLRRLGAAFNGVARLDCRLSLPAVWNHCVRYCRVVAPLSHSLCVCVYVMYGIGVKPPSPTYRVCVAGMVELARLTTFSLSEFLSSTWGRKPQNSH